MADLATIADIVYKLGFPVFMALYLLVFVTRVTLKLIAQNAEMLGILRDVKTLLLVRKE